LTTRIVIAKQDDLFADMKRLRTISLLQNLGVRPKSTLLLFAALASTSFCGLAQGIPKNTVVATVAVGKLPIDLVVSPDNSLVYVANQVPQTISGINTATNQVAFNFSVGGEPSNLAITPDGASLYCDEVLGNVDLQFSMATKQLVHSFATGSGTAGQAVSPDGSLVYIANYNSGTVTVISNGSLLSPIVVGNFPTYVIFSPDGSKAYIANQAVNAYYVSVIATATNTVTATITSVPYPFGGVAISPDGKTLYLTGVNASEDVVLAVIDTTSNTVSTTIFLAKARHFPGKPAITPDGRFVYIPLPRFQARLHDPIAMVNAATNQVVAPRTFVGAHPGAMAIRPDGKYAYVANYLDATVSVIDITPN
jgi:YVTN family beta-propeller protein